jgi:hypothetical protein
MIVVCGGPGLGETVLQLAQVGQGVLRPAALCGEAATARERG